MLSLAHFLDPLTAGRGRSLAVHAVKRNLAGRESSSQTCRVCGTTAPCRPYDFRVRRHLRFVEPGGLGANTTWIMAKHQDMVTGSGAVCARCMENCLQPYFAKVTQALLLLAAALCLPLPVALLFLRGGAHRATADPVFLLACFAGVLFLLGLTCLNVAWFADRFFGHKVNEAILTSLAAVERAPLRERFPPGAYALQMGLRFTDEKDASDANEVVSSDDQ